MINEIHRIQIYGERCSGTNYLQHLLEKNLKSATCSWDHGWKHWFHGKEVEAAKNCLFVVIYRNPFDWLRSFHQEPWHAAPELRSVGFSDFIRKEWWCIWDEAAECNPGDSKYGTEFMAERNPATNQRFRNVIQMRTGKIRNWESLRNKAKNNVYIKYEDLRSNPKVVLHDICERFRIRKTEHFENIYTYRGIGGEYRPKIYDPIKPEDLNYIVYESDRILEQSIGYDLLALAEEMAMDIDVPPINQARE